MRLMGLTAGEVAFRTLRREPSVGEVLAVFPRTVHLRTGDGEMLALCSRGVENGPLNIRLDAPNEFAFTSLGLLKGEKVCFSSKRISIDTRMFADLSSLAMWQPRTLRKALSKTQISHNQRTLLELVVKEGRREGLLGLLSLLMPGHDVATEGNPYVRRGLEAASQLLRGASSGNDDELRSGISGLIGLGPGLTPAGDDVITGFVTALREAERLGIVADGSFSNLERLIPVLSRGRTSLLSESMLRMACEGLAGESAAEMVNSLYGSDPRSVRKAARRLIGVGHSSGTDMLVGVLLATTLFSSGRSRPVS